MHLSLFSTPSKCFYCITEIGAYKLQLHALFTMDIIKGNIILSFFITVWCSFRCIYVLHFVPLIFVYIYGNTCKHIFSFIFSFSFHLIWSSHWQQVAENLAMGLEMEKFLNTHPISTPARFEMNWMKIFSVMSRNLRSDPFLALHGAKYLALGPKI